ncbi:MAG TPA: PEFG-CTERM sorting domain-containing protein [Nitrosopumilaceae archaeon]|nr:PEFG-CTERM sorting domain-containing protein [Nitrosopumilaceae archaeon]
MKRTQKIMLNSFLVLFAISIGMIFNPAFADHETANVSIGIATSTPGCQETKECYIPYQVSVDVGGEVTWMNDDGAAHTVTSGLTPFPGIDGDGPSGVFDSGMFLPQTSFSHQFESAGEFPYYCIVHPWMEGLVIVQGVGGAELVGSEPKGAGSEGSEYAPGTLVVGAPSEEETTVTGISEDGSIRAEITSSNPASDEKMSLEIKFRDSNDGSVKEHANYDIVVSQNGQEILSVLGEHAHEGTSIHSTASLSTSDQVDIEVTMLGFGLPDDQENWSGPKGEILMFNVVPEFGTVALVVMFVAISVVVLTSSKYTRVIPRL